MIDGAIDELTPIVGTTTALVASGSTVPAGIAGTG